MVFDCAGATKKFAVGDGEDADGGGLKRVRKRLFGGWREGGSFGVRCFDFFPSSVHHTHPPLARSFLHPHKFSCSASCVVPVPGTCMCPMTYHVNIITCTYIIDVVTSLSNHNGSCCAAKITKKSMGDNNVSCKEREEESSV